MGFAFSFLISGMLSVDRMIYGKVGLRVLSYYKVTTLIGAFTCVTLAVLIQPGKSSRNTAASSGGNVEVVHTVNAFLDLIRDVSNYSQ